MKKPRPAKTNSPGKAATLRQVAALAKVSAMTVSNFMNGRFQAMSEETRARIAQTVAELNYRPHSAGRGLRTATGLLIGMILVDAAPADVTPASYFIRVGTIRQRNELPPKVQIWNRSAQQWVEDLASLPRVEKQ